MASTRSAAAALLLSLWLAACGGGDDAPPPPTELPQSLAVTAPVTRQALGASVAFSSNAVDPARALTYRWDFGDGATSSLADPGHAYARPGTYTVRLTLANEAGASRSAAATLTVADVDVVRGKTCSGARDDGTGWCWQRPLPQGNAIADYAFADDTHGWAVGEGGTLLATSDGGVSWRAQPSGTGLNLVRTAFASARVGWVAGSNGELLKTSDGGATWSRVSFGQSQPVATLGAADADTAWLTTSSAAYATTDGGTHWKRIVPASYSTRLAMSGPADVWSLSCCDYDYSTGSYAPRLSHTADAGATWVNVALPAVEAGLSRSITDLQFIDARRGLLVGYESGYSSVSRSYVLRYVAWRTADGGASWQALAPPQGSGLPASYGSAAYQLVDAATVAAWVYGDGGLRVSADAGASWRQIPWPAGLAAGTGSYVASFKAYSAQRLLVRDGSGRTWLTTDAGAHWDERGAGGVAAASISGLWFFDSREGLAIGADGSGVRTLDGGQTWTTTAASGSVYGWRRLQFLPGSGTGWVISSYGGGIYLTFDKGRTWLAPVMQTNALPLASVSDFHFVDVQHGWALGYGWSSSAALYVSSDGGSSWRAVADSAALAGYAALRFADATHGVAVGPAGIAMVSDDGGATWSPRPTGIDRNLSRVAFADAATAVAVGAGGAIVRSTDAGRNWTRVASPTAIDLEDVRFVSATTGYATGALGTLLGTTDGGVTWTLQTTGARAGLHAVFFVDEYTGWAAGDNGAILATASGGR